ncbi:MAG: V-type ATP synthase subunit D [Candidatus Woesearchaeota archaeon]
MEIKPTRMGLLQTKKRLSLADKGYDLLKQKYDALMMKFFEQVKKVTLLRDELATPCTNASTTLLLAQSFSGVGAVEQEITLRDDYRSLALETRKVYGVTHPILVEQKDSTPQEAATVSRTSSAQIEVAASLMEGARSKLLQLINEQLALVMIAKEIARTKKKVNSLEKRVIPELQETQKRITFVLEEQERELFTTLKLVKDRKQDESTTETE